MAAYSQGGFVKRMVASGGDKEKLQDLDDRLSEAMQVRAEGA